MLPLAHRLGAGEAQPRRWRRLVVQTGDGDFDHPLLFRREDQVE